VRSCKQDETCCFKRASAIIYETTAAASDACRRLSPSTAVLPATRVGEIEKSKISRKMLRSSFYAKSATCGYRIIRPVHGD
jgi:hypothetical protein